MTERTRGTFETGLELLLLFEEGTGRLSVSELAARLGLPVSTTYRYVKTLRSYRFLEPCEPAGHYRLGLRCLQLARLVHTQLTIPGLALPVMQQLTQASGETTLLTVRYGLQAICAEKVESPQTLRLSFERGKVMPLHAGASSVVLLAFADKVDIDEVLRAAPQLRFTDHTITEPDAMAERLRSDRAKGYVFSESEVDLDTRAIAAPVYDAAGRLAAGLSIAGPAQRLPDERTPALARQVIDAAHQVSRMALEKGVFLG